MDEENLTTINSIFEVQNQTRQEVFVMRNKLIENNSVIRELKETLSNVKSKSSSIACSSPNPPSNVSRTAPSQLIQAEPKPVQNFIPNFVSEPSSVLIVGDDMVDSLELKQCNMQ